MDTIKIMQHNVAHWRTNKTTLIQTYNEINPDIILINSHGLKSSEQLKIHGYITYKVNSSEELHDGSAILIKQNIEHRIDDDFITDILLIKIETINGPINFATTYLPPRRPYLPFPDIHKIMSNNNPTYLIGDFNAKHPFLGDSTSNNVGKGLKIFHDRNTMIHHGPNFPTYISGRNATTPDLILSNNKIFHNFLITQGPVTSSDHLPLIITLTTKAIKKAIAPTYKYMKADWGNFKNEIQDKINNTHINNTLSQNDIEGHLKEWYNIIEKAMQNNIPKTCNIIDQKPISNNTIKNLQYTLGNLTTEARNRGWTHHRFIVFKYVKKLLQEECKKQSTENWENKIGQLTTKYKHPKEFWKLIKQLKGNTESCSPYLIRNNEKIYDEKQKAEIFKEIWENVFRISREENIEFDRENERMVNNFINNNEQLLNPHCTHILVRAFLY